MAKSKIELKRKVQTQNMIIIALAIIIAVLIGVSSTAAWYIVTRTDSADIILSNPVNIYITEFTDVVDGTGNPVYGADGVTPIKQHTLKKDILEEYNTKVYPGDKIRMRLGMQIGDGVVESSNAYVRVKLTVTYENIYTNEVGGLDDLAADKLIEFVDYPNPDMWERVDFNDVLREQSEDPTTVPEDIWYVLKISSSESRIAKDKETFEFIDGYIKLSKTEITNAQSNCKFHIHYVVEAIRVANVPDPLSYRGFGPWWNFAKGDLYD